MIRALTLFAAYFAGAFLVTAALNWMAAWKWRRATAAHWTERARLLWPVRTCGAANLYIYPLFSFLLQFSSNPHSLTRGVVAGIAGWMGTMLGTYPLDREIQPELNFTKWLRTATLAWSFRLVYGVVWLGAGLMMPENIVWQTFVIAGFVLAFQLAMHQGLWMRILVWLGVLTGADDRLQTIVTSTSERMQVSIPCTWLLDVPLANALALISTHELIFTAGLMKVCNDDEVSAICAHELAHLTESKGVRFLRFVGSLIWFPFLFVRPSLQMLDGAGILFVLFAFCLLLMLRKSVGRRMENRADSKAAEQQNSDGVYARALEKLYRENQMPAVSSSSHKTHPHLYDRMLAAGIQPEFERPKAPDPVTLIYVFTVIVLPIVVGLVFSQSHH